MDTLFCATEQSILFMELFHICNILYAQLYCNIKMQFIHRFVTISKNHLEFLLKSTRKRIFPFVPMLSILQSIALFIFYRNQYFPLVTADSRITFDPNLVNRFLTFSRILEPDSKLGTFEHLNHYYEEPKFDYVHI